MKRIALWLLSTVTVVVLLFGYHTSTSGVLAVSAPPSVFSGTTAASPSVSPSTSPASRTRTGKKAGKAGKKATSGASSTPAPTATTRTVTGTTAQTQWGPVQVELTMSGSSISKVDVLQYPTGNPRDTQIADYALPILIQETLSAQSARIDMVSGASYTSAGYVQSLQSALDQAGA